MKYTILINQAGIAASGLTDKTNFDDWAVLDYIAGWQMHHGATLRDGHTWINFKHLLSEMPLLRTASKQGVSDIIKKLKDLGLVTAIYDTEKRVYLKLTSLYHDAVGFQACPKNNEGVKHDGQGVKQALQGGVKLAGHTADYQFSTDNQEQLPPIVPKGGRKVIKPEMHEFDQFWLVYPKKRAGSQQRAKAAYQKAVKRGFSEHQIISGAAAYAVSREVAGGYAKGAAAWLNDDRFTNDYSEKQNGQAFRPNSGNPTKTDRINAVLAEAKRNIDAGITGFVWSTPDGGNAHPVLSSPEPVREGAGTVGGGHPVVPDGSGGLFHYSDRISTTGTPVDK